MCHAWYWKLKLKNSNGNVTGEITKQKQLKVNTPLSLLSLTELEVCCNLECVCVHE